MHAWLKLLAIIGLSGTIGGCSEAEGLVTPDQIRLEQPLSIFRNSPNFKVTLDGCQFIGEFTNGAAYHVYCAKGKSKIITVTSTQKSGFSRDEAIRIARQILPKPELNIVEVDSEDLQKLDAKPLCEHLYFRNGYFADLYYRLTKSGIKRIEVYAPRNST